MYHASRIEPLESRTMLAVDSPWSTVAEFEYEPGRGGIANAVAFDASGDLFSAGNGIDSSGMAHAFVVKQPAGASEPVQSDEFTFGFGLVSRFFDVGTDASGNVFSVGTAQHPDGSYHWIVRRSTDDGATWATVDDYRHAGGRMAEANAFASDADGNIYVAGYDSDLVVSRKTTTSRRHWIVRKSSDGGATWQTMDDFQLSSTTNAEANDILVLPSGLYTVGEADARWIARRSTDGGQSWSVIDNYTLDSQWGTRGNGIAGDAAGTLYAVGTGITGQKMTRTGRWLVRKSADGGATWQTVDNFQLPGNIGWTYGSYAEDVVTDPSGNVFVVGSGTTGGPYDHHLLVRASANGGTTWGTVDDVPPHASGHASRGFGAAVDPAGNVFASGQVGGETSTKAVVRSNAAPAGTPTGTPTATTSESVATTGIFSTSAIEEDDDRVLLGSDAGESVLA